MTSQNPQPPTAAPHLSSITDPASIAACLALPPNGLASQILQIQHRQRLNDEWAHWIGGEGSRGLAGLRVLEIGCGQGDHTAVLAAAVGEQGKVVALDPGRLDYGSPFTLHQAQTFLKQSPLGARITFHRATAPDFLSGAAAPLSSSPTSASPASPPASPSPPYDAAVLSHSLWYFSSRASVLSTLSALRHSGTRTLLLSEWALEASQPSAVPHLLAVLAQAGLAPATDDESNVRSPLSPRALQELALAAGWALKASGTVRCPSGMRDGQWEVMAAQAMLGAAVESEGRAWECHRDALAASVRGVGGVKGVECMDVWWAVFE